MQSNIDNSCLSCEMLARFKASSKEHILSGRSREIRDNSLISVMRSKDYSFESIQYRYDGLVRHTPYDQKVSGKCWLCAGLNCARYLFSKNYGTDTIFSDSYLFFYDKLERANFFLEQVIALDGQTDNRVFDALMESPADDAGQWEMFLNLTRKYGLVPADMMDNARDNEDTTILTAQLNDILRSYARVLIEKHIKGADRQYLREIKTNMLASVYGMLAACLGEPPEIIRVCVKSNDGKTIIIEDNISPLQFYNKYFGNELDDYICVINIPCPRWPMDTRFELLYTGNVIEGKNICLYNIQLSVFKQLVEEQIQAGLPVWIGCDSRKYFDRSGGLLSLNIIDRNLVPYEFANMDKGNRVLYRISCANHAMVLTGLFEKSNVNEYLCVENSYGESFGDKGFGAMSYEWFDAFVFQAVIHKDYCSEFIQRTKQKEPRFLYPWDPVAKLAKLEGRR